MAQHRRTAYAFFYAHDGTFVDIPLLLRGTVELAPLRQLFAISILTAREHAVSGEELELLLELPADRWTDTTGLDEDQRPLLAGLAEKGLLVSDEPDETLSELRRRDARLTDEGWNLYAALYHFMTKWRDVDVERVGELAVDLVKDTSVADLDVEQVLDRLGPPPDHFHALANAARTQELPLPARSGQLYDVLLARKTTREFDSSRPVSEDDLAAVLYYTFGCHGLALVSPRLGALKKTSPSGGAMHPIEVYPLVLNVAGVEPGLYHYDVRNHALELAVPLAAAEAAEWAREFTAGQSYFGSAHVLFVLTGRFWRSFWKYRGHQRAYAVLLMDAAHLSQTLYLVCTELGLGAFVTAAVNAHNVEDRLGLDPVAEGVLAVCGCGVPAPGRSELEPEFRPYVPRETVLP